MFQIVTLIILCKTTIRENSRTNNQPMNLENHPYLHTTRKNIRVPLQNQLISPILVPPSWNFIGTHIFNSTNRPSHPKCNISFIQLYTHPHDLQAKNFSRLSPTNHYNSSDLSLLPFPLYHHAKSQHSRPLNYIINFQPTSLLNGYTLQLLESREDTMQSADFSPLFISPTGSRHAMPAYLLRKET